jgi:Hpt domain
MHLDLNVLRGIIGDNVRIQRRIHAKFGDLIDESRAKIIRAVNTGALEVVRLTCHGLKSGSRSVGAIELGRISEQLETIGAGRTPVLIKPVLARFLDECSAVEGALSEDIDETG